MPAASEVGSAAPGACSLGHRALPAGISICPIVGAAPEICTGPRIGVARFDPLATPRHHRLRRSSARSTLASPFAEWPLVATACSLLRLLLA